jgi:hypothetical protein
MDDPYLDQAWYVEFLLEIDLKNLLGKTGVRLILKTELIFLNIDPGVNQKSKFVVKSIKIDVTH